MWLWKIYLKKAKVLKIVLHQDWYFMQFHNEIPTKNPYSLSELIAQFLLCTVGVTYLKSWALHFQGFLILLCVLSSPFNTHSSIYCQSKCFLSLSCSTSLGNYLLRRRETKMESTNESALRIYNINQFLNSGILIWANSVAKDN